MDFSKLKSKESFIDSECIIDKIDVILSRFKNVPLDNIPRIYKLCEKEIFSSWDINVISDKNLINAVVCGDGTYLHNSIAYHQERGIYLSGNNYIETINTDEMSSEDSLTINSIEKPGDDVPIKLIHDGTYIRSDHWNSSYKEILRKDYFATQNFDSYEDNLLEDWYITTIPICHHKSYAPYRTENRVRQKWIHGDPLDTFNVNSNIIIANGRGVCSPDSEYIFTHDWINRQHVNIDGKIVDVTRSSFFKRLSPLYMPSDILDCSYADTFEDILNTPLEILLISIFHSLYDDVASEDKIDLENNSSLIEDNPIIGGKGPCLLHNGVIKHECNSLIFGKIHRPWKLNSLKYGSSMQLTGLRHNSIHIHKDVNNIHGKASIIRYFDPLHLDFLHNGLHTRNEILDTGLPDHTLEMYGTYDSTINHDYYCDSPLQGYIIERENILHDSTSAHHHVNHNGEMIIKSGEDYLWQSLFI